ncbi:MAG: GTPase ObgE, partial [Pseudomonadota bacterium]
SRTGLLLHVVDVAPIDEHMEPVHAVQAIETELQNFSAELVAKERWLVLNKVDLIAENEREAHCAEIVAQLGWQGPVFQISALNKLGTRGLCFAIMEHIERAQGEGDDACAADEPAPAS